MQSVQYAMGLIMDNVQNANLDFIYKTDQLVQINVLMDNIIMITSLELVLIAIYYVKLALKDLLQIV